jgi:hypothetical protein
MSDLFIINLKFGNRDTLVSTSQESNNVVNIVANSNQPTRYLSISVTKTTPIYAILYDADLTIYLYDKNLSLLSRRSTPVTAELLYVLVPNTEYFIKLDKEASPNIGDVLGYLAAYTEITVSSLFPNGIENKAILSANLTRQVNGLGEVLYNFINYPLTQNDIIHLSSAGPSVNGGNINIVSSNTAVFDNQTETFTPPGGVEIFIIAKQTIVYTGTIMISCDSVGSIAQQETGYVLN